MPRPADGNVSPADDAAELQRLIDRHTRTETLAEGTSVMLRPVVPADKADLQAGMSRMSEDARYRRFMAMISELSSERLRYLTEIDYVDHFALGALALDQQPPLGIGVARYVRDPDEPHVAEPAITVVDAYQGRGLGNLLLERIMAAARGNGITHFRATLLADNVAMKETFAQQGATFTYEDFGLLTAEFSLQ